MNKPALPQGTRDFGPDIVRKRSHILNTIRSVFELYGFQPLETPAMENLETLLGKYGDEGDKLIFKILNNGLDNPDKQEQARKDFEKVLAGKNVKGITERALKYDLTIPFARYVAMHHHKLVFPFKRYQIQPVWRADRPQRGRYREFIQCDADVVGSSSLLNETEFVLICHRVFTQLKLLEYDLRINSRRILTALAELCGGADRTNDIAMAIDKLDKKGPEQVRAELAAKGYEEDHLAIVKAYLGIQGTDLEKLKELEKLIGHTDPGRKGLEEINTLIRDDLLPAGVRLRFDPSLARGLNYYTGIIFEANAPEKIKMGSIGGGGRYDDLTGLFGVPGIPGVGFSFGIDRIYDVMEELDLFPPDVGTGVQVLFFNMGAAESKSAFKLMQELRESGISCELYHEPVKLDKQFKYAERKNIPYVLLLGSKELEENTCTVKNQQTGEQWSISRSEILNFKFQN